MSTDGSSPVLEVGSLGERWPCVDPFLMCNYHVDDYPAGDDSLGPRGGTGGRRVGGDFEGRDGWNMYHGTTVPGFPRHPHRGFETITYARRGYVDHSDSVGATARYGDGDVQWLTAGRGIEHAEMFPLVHTKAPNPLELFQVWVNLPSRNKLVEPRFSMLWNEDLPKILAGDPVAAQAVLTLIAGQAAGVRPPAPPPDSWAADPDADFAIWHLEVSAGACLTLPPASTGVSRVLYGYRDAEVDVAGTHVQEPSFFVLNPQIEVRVTAGPETVEALVLQGRPLQEPVAHYGPFVMNTHDELRTAFAEFDAHGFGDWNWRGSAPTHAAGRGRFARYSDGTVQERT